MQLSTLALFLTVPYFSNRTVPDSASMPQAYVSPAEMAAMLSAAYDGHEGRLGPGVGIRTADPTMKVVMGGMASQSPVDTVKMILLWVRAVFTGIRPCC